MDFIDMKHKKIDINNVEKTEQDMARKYIQSHHVVLELGARYGTVSCIINKKLNDKHNQVSVEPDQRVWKSLEINRKNQGSEFHIVKGFVSNKKLSLTNIDDYIDGYGSTAVIDDNSDIPSFTLQEIKDKYNLQFNVLVADCEGFLGEFFKDNPSFYDELEMIMFEADYPDKCDYNHIRKTLVDKGFEGIIIGHQNLYKKKM